MSIFFPLSFYTDKTKIFEELRICQSQCHNKQVDVYIASINEEDIDNAISISTNKLYKNLTNAYLYRKKYNSNITCNKIF